MTGPTIDTKVQISCGACPYARSRQWVEEDGNSYDWGYNHFCLKRDSAHVNAYNLRPEDCPVLTPHDPIHQPPRSLDAVHPVRDASGRRIDG